ncbi:hypothetical protein E4U45_006536, partial [Claviceps purpurea]
PPYHTPFSLGLQRPKPRPCHEHPSNDIAAMKARIIEDPKGVDAAIAIMTLRRDSDDHPQQHSRITTPPRRPERKHSLLELVPGMDEYGTSEEVESEKDGPRKD